MVHAGSGSEVSVSPVMGKGFRMERAPAADHPTCLLFATGSGISPIKALIESNELQVSQNIVWEACCFSASFHCSLATLPPACWHLDEQLHDIVSKQQLPMPLYTQSVQMVINILY